MRKIFLILLVSINLFAWEINTHRAIDKKALENVQNLEAFTSSVELFDNYGSEIFEGYYGMTYFKYISDGESNGISAKELKQIFDNANYKSLLEAGSILEDAQWPHLINGGSWNIGDMSDGRFLNHFYNPQVFDGNAVEWAYNAGRNQYNYTSAMDYFAKGFSESDINERRKYQAKMFVSVGNMLHMLNDMNVPAHVRSDLHPLFEPLEKYMKGGEDHNQNVGYYIKGNSKAGNLNPSASDKVTPQPNFQAFMKTEAEFTSTNFFSDDTIFEPYLTPNESTTHIADRTQFATYARSYIYNSNNTKIAIHVESYVINALNGIIATKQSNKMVLGDTSIFNGDTSVLEDSGKVLISHAIANASNFVNYFFRGHITPKVTSCGLQVTNDSKVDLVANATAVTFIKGGTFTVYADKADGERVYLTEKALDEDLILDQSIVIKGVASAYKEIFGEVSQNAKLTVVYEGNIGVDAGVTVSTEVYNLQELPKTQNGAVEVTLNWENDANYDLELAMPSSVKDVESPSCMEHAYVATEYDIYPGTYKVNVAKVSTKPVDGVYYVTIKTPGSIEVASIDASTTGHIADIHVKYIDNEPVIELETPSSINIVYSNGSDGSGSAGYHLSHHSGGGNGRTSSHRSYSSHSGYSCGDIPCEYWITWYESLALVGPLSDADISLFSLDAFKNQTSALYEGKTSSGNTLYTAGKLNIPEDVITSLDDETLYIIEVSGGTDIDKDDDMIVDTIGTPNLGTLHTLVTGTQLKQLKPKVNILTEVAYQIVKDGIADGSLTKAELIEKLDDIASRLLLAKIYTENTEDVNYTDLLDWLPTIDTALLYADYDTKVVPIVNKVLAGEKIYQNAYNLVYFSDNLVPIIKSKSYHIAENASIGSIVGDIEVQSEGNSSITNFKLYGNGSSNFSIASNGTITTKVLLDYEKEQFYSLFVHAQNSDGYSKYTAITISVDDVVDAPYITGFSFEEVYADTSIGTKVAQAVFESGSSAITSMQLSGEDSSYFTIDTNGTITTTKALEDFFTKKAYTFSLSASNNSGESLPIDVIVNIGDRRDIPLINNLTLYVDENTPPQSIIGQVPVVSDGDSPITSFTLDDSTLFNVDDNGTIKVAPNAVLDYEKQHFIDVNMTASNVIGDSREKILRVVLNDIPDVLPTLNDVNLSINKEEAVGSIIGNVLQNGGDSAITDVSLTNNPYFKLNTNGDIEITHSLLEQDDEHFTLQATMTNSTGESNTSVLNIDLITTPVVHDITINAFDNTGEYTEIVTLPIIKNGNEITSITLSGESDNFTVDTNGTLRVAQGVTLKAATKSDYLLYATINDTYNATIRVHIKDRIIGSVDTSGYARSITLSADNTKAFVADGGSGVQVIDITDPTNPKIISSIYINGASDIALSLDENQIYVSYFGSDGYGGMKIVDISDPLNLTIISSVSILDEVSNIALSADGFTTFITGSSGVQIVDVSDSTNPTIISSVNTPTLYINPNTDNSKIFLSKHIVDITDLNNPAITDLINLPKDSYCISFDTNQTKAFTTNVYSGGIQILDIIDPTNPIVLGSIKTSYRVLYIKLSEDGNTAFLTNHYNGILIVDISDPTNPIIIDSIDTPNIPNRIALNSDNSKAFIADGTSGIQIIDISGYKIEQKTPGILGFSTTIEASTSVGTVVGQAKIYYSGESGITSFELTGDRADDFSIDSDGIVKLAKELEVIPNNIYALKVRATNSVGTREEEITISVHSLPEANNFTGTVNSMATAETVVGTLDMLYDDNATISSIVLSGEGNENFTCDTSGNIYVAQGAELHHFVKAQYDLSATLTNDYGDYESNATIKVKAIITTVDTPDTAYGTALNNDNTKAFVADSYYGVQIIDITNPTNPTIIGSVDTSGSAHSITLSTDNTKAFVADGGSGVQIIDITDPANPAIIGSVDTSGSALSITLSTDNTKAFVADGTSGVQIIDITDSTNPAIISSIDISDFARSITLSTDNSKAFVANSGLGIQVIDITDPINPTIIGSVDTPSYAVGITLSTDNSKAFIADRNSGVQIIDITDPTNPIIIDSIDTPNSALGITLSADNTKAFVADGYYGVQIIDLTGLE
ncbi:cadherin domain-containing protein [Sulfurimonas sp.]|uniref:cadherin domain-containing protein n=2 Tax=Sulfurimonas sp. TaxID=2022749 RepID=UPI003D0BCF0B